MAEQDKVLLMNKVEGTLKTRMFANLLDEAVDEIQDHLDEFDVHHLGNDVIETEDLLTAFVNAKKVSGRSEKTIVRYQYVIGKLLDFSKVKIRDINAHHIREFFAREQERGICDTTIEGYREVFSGFFGWLDKEKLISKNPITNIEPIKCKKKERLALSFTDVELLRRNCNNLRNSAIINLLLSSGCRISELVGLNKDDINLDENEGIVLGKGNKERTIYMDDVASMTLKEYLASRNDTSEALFVNRFGDRLLQSSIREMLNDLAKKAGVEHVHPHRFRRTAVTNMLNRGMPIQEVAIIVGHERVDTTMKYFSKSKNRIKNSYRLYMQ